MCYGLGIDTGRPVERRRTRHQRPSARSVLDVQRQLESRAWIISGNKTGWTGHENAGNFKEKKKEKKDIDNPKKTQPSLSKTFAGCLARCRASCFAAMLLAAVSTSRPDTRRGRQSRQRGQHNRAQIDRMQAALSCGCSCRPNRALADPGCRPTQFQDGFHLARCPERGFDLLEVEEVTESIELAAA